MGVTHFPFFFSFAVKVMAAGESPSIRGRRIWTRCPFCLDMLDQPSKHFDSYAGCRGPLEESDYTKRQVMDKMRDDAYKFTANQTIRPNVVTRVLRRHKGGNKARACISDILKKLDIVVSDTAAVVSMEGRSSSPEETDHRPDDKAEHSNADGSREAAAGQPSAGSINFPSGSNSGSSSDSSTESSSSGNGEEGQAEQLHADGRCETAAGQPSGQQQPFRKLPPSSQKDSSSDSSSETSSKSSGKAAGQPSGQQQSIPKLPTSSQDDSSSDSSSETSSSGTSSPGSNGEDGQAEPMQAELKPLPPNLSDIIDKSAGMLSPTQSTSQRKKLHADGSCGTAAGQPSGQQQPIRKLPPSPQDNSSSDSSSETSSSDGEDGSPHQGSSSQLKKASSTESAPVTPSTRKCSVRLYRSPEIEEVSYRMCHPHSTVRFDISNLVYNSNP